MPSRDVYSATFRNITVDATSAAKSVIELSSASTYGIELLRVWLGTDVVASNVQEVTICKPSGAGSAGSAVTPVHLWGGTAAASSAYTGRGGLQSISNRYIVDQFNVLNGWIWIATKDDTIRIQPSEVLDIRFEASVVGSQEWWGGVIFKEL